MKTDLKFSVVLILFLATVIYCFIWHGGGANLEQARNNAQGFAAESVKAITGSWSMDELQKRAHPMLMQGVKESGNSLEEYFKVLGQLGTMKKDPDCAFLNVASVMVSAGKYLTASFMCNTEYANGPAAIGVEVRQEKSTGPWKIVNFQVNSPFFSKKTGNPKQDTPDGDKKAQ